MSNANVGRPKNATTRDLDTMRAEIASLRAEIQPLRGRDPAPKTAGLTPFVSNGPSMKELFFAHLLGATLGSVGFEAFSDMFLESLTNNAEKIWKTYQAIVTGEREAMLQTQIDEAVRARKVAEANLAASKRVIAEQAGLISREKADSREADGSGAIDASLSEGIEGESLLEEASI